MPFLRTNLLLSLSLFHISLLTPCLRLDPQIRFYEYNIQSIYYMLKVGF
jgi:hypothetical protein